MLGLGIGDMFVDVMQTNVKPRLSAVGFAAEGRRLCAQRDLPY
jgi:hypothetical protein